MISRRGLLLAAPVAALATWLPSRAYGALARALSLAELVQHSKVSLVGTPLEAESRWESGADGRRIVTYTQVRVEETYAGASAAEVLVRTLGGRVGSVGQLVPGEAVLALQQPSVLFLYPRAGAILGVSGMSQGEYPIIERERVRRLSISPRLPELRGPRGAVAQLKGRRLPKAQELIVKEWRRVH